MYGQTLPHPRRANARGNSRFQLSLYRHGCSGVYRGRGERVHKKIKAEFSDASHNVPAFDWSWPLSHRALQRRWRTLGHRGTADAGGAAGQRVGRCRGGRHALLWRHETGHGGLVRAYGDAVKAVLEKPAPGGESADTYRHDRCSLSPFRAGAAVGGGEKRPCAGRTFAAEVTLSRCCSPSNSSTTFKMHCRNYPTAVWKLK